MRSCSNTVFHNCFSSDFVISHTFMIESFLSKKWELTNRKEALIEHPIGEKYHKVLTFLTLVFGKYAQDHDLNILESMLLHAPVIFCFLRFEFVLCYNLSDKTLFIYGTHT